MYIEMAGEKQIFDMMELYKCRSCIFGSVFVETIRHTDGQWIYCAKLDINNQDLCSLRRFRFIGIGIPIVNPRRSPDRLRFKAGIPIGTRRCRLVNKDSAA